MLKKFGLAAGAVALVGAPIALQASEAGLLLLKVSKSLAAVQTV